MHVAGIVLAAGGSLRLGEPKQLVCYRGEPLVRRAAMALAQAGARPVIVVVGCESARVSEAVRGVPHVTTATNDGWRRGIASSITTGVREAMRADASIDAVLVTLSDQPLVDAPALARLLAALGPTNRIVASEYAGTIGVPAVIGREHFDELLALEGDAGAGRWLREKESAVSRVPMPDAALDIDRADDRDRLGAMT